MSNSFSDIRFYVRGAVAYKRSNSMAFEAF